MFCPGLWYSNAFHSLNFTVTALSYAILFLYKLNFSARIAKLEAVPCLDLLLLEKSRPDLSRGLAAPTWNRNAAMSWSLLVPSQVMRGWRTWGVSTIAPELPMKWALADVVHELHCAGSVERIIAPADGVSLWQDENVKEERGFYSIAPTSCHYTVAVTLPLTNQMLIATAKLGDSVSSSPGSFSFIPEGK